MNRRIASARCFAAAWIAAVALALALFASSPAEAHRSKANSNDTSQALTDYIARVRSTVTEVPGTGGSLWSPQARWANLAVDDKAHNVGDIVTILLSDSFSSTSNDSIKTARTYGASSGVTAAFGTVSSTSGWQNLFSPNSSETLNGSGQSAITSSLAVTLAGQVMDVLPNGALVIQAARNIFVGNQRQTIIVRGILRPDDISPTNVANSSSVTNLEVEVKGKGVVSNGTRPPNAIIRAIMKVLNF
ncbi:MAG TPA: flagellar basal body L-ring protein FlgH [Candidatus Baltobacteraceae bacterium]|nr:flagellar basal body L-ring protein FlgH [Candidatus Baltobacteraceae bacterium]